MDDSFPPHPPAAPGSDTAIYLERDIFFNPRLRCLEGAAGPVALNFRECILLRLLLTARVRKQAVIDAAWGDNGVVVTDASYHQLVRSLRKKFAEIGLSAQSIRTLPRFGLEYIRDAPPPPLPVPETASFAAVSAMDEGGRESGSLPWRLSGAGGKRWSLRLVLLILPFLAGLLIGHLGYRGAAISAKKTGGVSGLEVSVSKPAAANAS